MSGPTIHFSWNEFTLPNAAVVGNIADLAAVLETIREAINAPIVITSGYRSKAHNKAIGGSSTSDHCLGLAADFTVNGYASNALAERARGALLAQGVGWDQLIWYSRDRHVHLGLGHRMRRMFFQGG